MRGRPASVRCASCPRAPRRRPPPPPSRRRSCTVAPGLLQTASSCSGKPAAGWKGPACHSRRPPRTLFRRHRSTDRRAPAGGDVVVWVRRIPRDTESCQRGWCRTNSSAAATANVRPDVGRLPLVSRGTPRAVVADRGPAARSPPRHDAVPFEPGQGRGRGSWCKRSAVTPNCANVSAGNEPRGADAGRKRQRQPGDGAPLPAGHRS